MRHPLRDDGRREGGFTLVEVIVASMLVMIIVGLTAQALLGGNETFQTVSLKSSAEVAANQVLTQVLRSMENGSEGTLVQPDGTAFTDGTTYTDGFRVQLVSGYSDGLLHDQTVQFDVVAGESDITDGTDNDGDNIIDEFDLKLMRWDSAPPADLTAPDEVTTIASGLTAFSIVKDEQTLTLTISVQRYDQRLEEQRTFTIQRVLLLRN